MGRGRGVVNMAQQPVRPSAQPSPRTHKPVAQVVPAAAQRPEHPFEEIPPCQPAPQPSINIQAPVGVIPDQTRVKPVGRGRSVGAPPPAACYAGLGGGDSPLTGGRDGKMRGSSVKASNSGQLCDCSALNLGSKSNGASFGTGHGRGSPRGGVIVFNHIVSMTLRISNDNDNYDGSDNHRELTKWSTVELTSSSQ